MELTSSLFNEDTSLRRRSPEARQAPLSGQSKAIECDGHGAGSVVPLASKQRRATPAKTPTEARISPSPHLWTPRPFSSLDATSGLMNTIARHGTPSCPLARRWRGTSGRKRESRKESSWPHLYDGSARFPVLASPSAFHLPESLSPRRLGSLSNGQRGGKASSPTVNPETARRTSNDWKEAERQKKGAHPHPPSPSGPTVNRCSLWSTREAGDETLRLAPCVRGLSP
ncbi:hypothetical protein FA10DRAFT_151367 [Acaromyces ingoldii]|uniref:Uncharacterized protein n=1 Tax=Acaromyces ingoldii TaxID=215250 RepID=A0A316YJH3_9BASI|nr:hypothetical protein FA10DRAFT_151367 [Acaromyces ingoldii]PWN89690.1 hypothetical protein FA10DRAFT_151367 [Acaromyces ingoldii]